VGVRFDSRSVTLFGLGYLISRTEGRLKIDKDRFAQALLISRSRLDHLLGDLRRGGLIEKSRYGIGGHILTSDGDREYALVLYGIEDLDLAPERFGIARHAKAGIVLEMVRDPLEAVRIISMILKRGSLDLPSELDRARALEPGSRERIMMEEMMSAGKAYEDIEAIITNFMMVCDDSEIEFENLDNTLIDAEMKRRAGQVEEAKCLFLAVLSQKTGIDPGRKLISLIGLIQSVRSLEGSKGAFDLMDEILVKMRDPVQMAILHKFYADILSDIKEFDRANKLYHSCLGTFRAKKMYLLESTIILNQGVLYFRQDKLDLAERCWIKARNLARTHDFPYVKTIAEINLADFYAICGKIKKAKGLLRSARAYMERIGDWEKVTGVDFNMALVYVEEGDQEKAMRFFSRSEEFPLLNFDKWQERRDVFNERFRKKGWPVPFNI